MAKTAKKSSTSKRKTKRAPAKITAKKTIAAKVTNDKSKPEKSVTLQRLYKFNLFAAMANLLFAVLSVVFLSKESLNAVITYSTKDELASTSATVLGTAYNSVLTVEVRYVVAALFVISAVLSLLLATRLRNAYETGVKNSVSALRWVFMGITLGLSLEIATALAGIEDMMTLKLVALLIVITTILGFMSERANKGSKKQYTAFGLSLLTGVIAWFPLAASLIGTTILGTESFGWYVYALSALLLAGFSSIALTQYRQIRDGVSAKGYLQLEGKYVSTDFLIKFGTFAIIILALHK